MSIQYNMYFFVCEHSLGSMLGRDYLGFFPFSVMKCLVRSSRREEGFVWVHI